MKYLSFILSASLLTSTMAYADEPQGADDAQSDRLEMRKERHSMKHRRHRSPGVMIEKVDTNNDGQVDLSEFLANAEQRFNKMDLNSDGFLTLEEGREMHEKMRAKHKEMRKKHREERRQYRKSRRDEQVEPDNEGEG